MFNKLWLSQVESTTLADYELRTDHAENSQLSSLTEYARSCQHCASTWLAWSCVHVSGVCRTRSVPDRVTNHLSNHAMAGSVPQRGCTCIVWNGVSVTDCHDWSRSLACFLNVLLRVTVGLNQSLVDFPSLWEDLGWMSLCFHANLTASWGNVLKPLTLMIVVHHPNSSVAECCTDLALPARLAAFRGKAPGASLRSQTAAAAPRYSN